MTYSLPNFASQVNHYMESDADFFINYNAHSLRVNLSYLLQRERRALEKGFVKCSFIHEDEFYFISWSFQYEDEKKLEFISPISLTPELRCFDKQDLSLNGVRWLNICVEHDETTLEIMRQLKLPSSLAAKINACAPELIEQSIFV